ncbi:hypothetical protein GCM10011490_22590 [Pseudoclavibacter endophyticus]|uniref:HAD family hydrolase n=1 Tax=Pseudoclavibacter endophyticus TaxID=1778590 RepID=A0A6H9WQD5_9MICO|nr:HAD family hydrolase [Pseudoclavibacter endophyticus]KAB1648291.1 HAD family hydrolase [Pseudoclavibacter endophyticus]GGA71384.1 hypothetical protein GCM10011490_22590 [Pseudoclavibacter endophyticus]
MFDFDGTVAVGDGPVLAYASAVARRLAPAAARDFLRDIETALTHHREAGFGPEFLDGYDLVARRACSAGLSPSEVSEAYLCSRSLLGTAQAAVTTPDGLAELLRDLGRCVHIALVTNAPIVRLLGTLESLGVAERFDEVIYAAGKPSGLVPFAGQRLAVGRVLSVGDIWENDLAPVAALGGDTALIGRPAPGIHPTFHAPTLAELAASIRAWASCASRPAHAPPPHRRGTPHAS